jgi:hypothetical protein
MPASAALRPVQITKPDIRWSVDIGSAVPSKRGDCLLDEMMLEEEKSPRRLRDAGLKEKDWICAQLAAPTASNFSARLMRAALPLRPRK